VTCSLYSGNEGQMRGSASTGAGMPSSSRTMFGEDDAALRDMACRANKVVLNTADSDHVVRDHVRQDELGATRCTTHRSAPARSQRARVQTKGLTAVPGCGNIGYLAASNGSPIVSARGGNPSGRLQRLTVNLRGGGRKIRHGVDHSRAAEESRAWAMIRTDCVRIFVPGTPPTEPPRAPRRQAHTLVWVVVAALLLVLALAVWRAWS
jgi:hypothetical protein